MAPKAKETTVSVEKKIENARRNGSTELNLSESGLHELPEAIWKLDQLTSLHLGGNQLTAVPESIGKLTHLTALELWGNQLTAVPESLGQLTQLTQLDLGGNRLTALPESIGQLTHLTQLHLRGNQLTGMPESLGQLTRLTQLNLGGNQLTAVPESLGQLTQLTQLELSYNQLTAVLKSLGQLTQLTQLYLGGNELTALPESIGKLTHLTTLDLWGNQLTAVPKSLGQLTRLTQLHLSGNQLTAVPESLGQLTQLTQLHLGGNQLTAVPESLGQLIQLTLLDLSDNQLTAVPESIRLLLQLKSLGMSRNRLVQLPEWIGRLINLELLDASSCHLEHLPESLREPGNLRQLFLHENPGLAIPAELLGPTHTEVGTRGKEPVPPGKILEYYFRTRKGRRPLNEAKLILVGRGEAGKTSIVNRLIHNRFNPTEKKTEGIKIDSWTRKIKGQDVRLNVWDFGGQEIMHATHQFFLSQRSLYLLVLSGRDDLAEQDADYWLKLIASFGGESPVILILNKIKAHSFDVNRRALRGKYPSIKAIVETDCASGKNGFGFSELKKVIDRETHELDGLRDMFPADWFRIKDQLAGMKQNYLRYEQYQVICSENGESDSAAQENLTVYLHRLGIALNYRDDPRLQDTHVLNPHWATNGIYTILNSNLIRKAAGEVRLGDLSKLLNQNDYPADMRRFLMDLMKKFELCFTFPDGDAHYLIPELLDRQEPPEAGQFDYSTSLNFRYDYPILPEGLLPRFIVRSHHLSEGQARWHTGVVLVFEGCQALVKADPLDKRVSISVTGSTASRRRLLAVIRSDFESIHGDIKALNPVEMVPLADHPAFPVPYQQLLKREEEGKLTFDHWVGDKFIDLDARELLEGIELRGSRRTEARMAGNQVRVFCSYSHKDEAYRNDLVTHLKILERENVIETWHDRMIGSSDEWKKAIDENLQRADIVLLLISADFISSDYCYEIELGAALKRHSENQARVVPLIVRDCNWQIARFSGLQSLPKDGKAVTLWPDKDTAWRNVSEGIEKLARKIIEEKRQRQ